MAHIISVLGNKGGTGKTTISHLLGHGFGMHELGELIGEVEAAL
jgi:cellulose biosynthesis protein BcsQ